MCNTSWCWWGIRLHNLVPSETSSSSPLRRLCLVKHMRDGTSLTPQCARDRSQLLRSGHKRNELLWCRRCGRKENRISPPSGSGRTRSHHQRIQTASLLVVIKQDNEHIKKWLSQWKVSPTSSIKRTGLWRTTRFWQRSTCAVLLSLWLTQSTAQLQTVPSLWVDDATFLWIWIIITVTEPFNKAVCYIAPCWLYVVCTQYWGWSKNLVLLVYSTWQLKPKLKRHIFIT